MDVDTRRLRYLVAVAESGNLTRAAQALYISQPALTKQIRSLESQLGVELFVRSKAGMTLTPAGAVLVRRLPRILEDLGESFRATRAAASRAARVLRVGFISSAANEYTQQIVAQFRRRHPGWQVQMHPDDWADPTAGLGTGLVDVALLRLPIPDQERFRVEWLLTEQRWVALPSDHRLAGQREIDFVELLEEPFVVLPTEAGSWRDYWLAREERQGRAVRTGPVVHNIDEFLTAIANGYGVSLAPEATARFYQRPGIVYVPVRGVSPSDVGVAWSPGSDDDPVLRSFVQASLALCRNEAAPGPG